LIGEADGKMLLEGKVAVITGAASGIGLATARLFAREGATLSLGDVDVKAGRRAAEEIGADGGRAEFVETDVTSAEDVRGLIDGAVGRHGKLDIVFNNAGISLTKPIPDTTEEEFDRVVAINFKGVFLGCKYAIPHLLDNPEGGAILNMSSNGGLIGRPGDPLYSATKHAVMGLTKSLAVTYADKKIRANALCPGAIDTPMIDGIIASHGDREKGLRSVLANSPTPRVASADEVARAGLFLVSPQNGYVNGVGLAVDGAKAAGVFNADRYRTDFELWD
jgi:NAD(P)-dependent dehydrogenase (short-subunit alcohol dehydrogenase family)